MKPTLTPRETGGYSNSARLRLLSTLTQLSGDLVCFNRDTWKLWKIGDRKISRWVFAYAAESIATVRGWKVETGGGQVQSFEPAVKYALNFIIGYNASIFFNNVSEAQVASLADVIMARKSHMSLYAVTDALESLVQREEPCIIDTFGFDAKAIMQACDAYWKKAKAEYYEWEKAGHVKQAHDLKPGDPVPAYVTELRQKMEERFGVVYGEEETIERMRAAAERYRQEQLGPVYTEEEIETIRAEAAKQRQEQDFSGGFS